MNGVTGMTTLLLETEMTDEQRDFVEAIHSCGDSLLCMANDVLDFSKIESGKLELEHHVFDLRTCIEESLELLAPTAAEKKLDLAYELDDSVPVSVIGDVTRLRQILVNLVGNAVKFTAAGEVVVKGTLGEGDGRPGMLHFSVQDTGIGIPNDKRDRLFKSFSQVDSSTTRQYGGTGLGLVISKRLAESMGGHMWVESEPAQGSTFHFTIETEPVTDVVSASFKDRHPQLVDRRVLVVEDSCTNRRILAYWLTKFGMHCSTVATHHEALELLQKNAFDAAILDFQLPEADGLSLAQAIRELSGGRSLRLLLLTSVHLRAGDPRAGEVRISVSIYKPIRPKQLLDALCQCFDQHRKTRKAPATPMFDATFASRHPLRILMADDSQVNQKVGCSFLEKLGYRAEVVSNGFEVLDAFERQPYDLVFLDVQMPEMDGYEAARQLGRRWKNEDSPCIIAMTGNAMQGDREKCLRAGMDDYIAKPVRVEDIRTALERWGKPSR